jgi:hypothetical protein
VCDIERRDHNELSLEDFAGQFLMLQRPVLITGNLTSDWRAWRRWTQPSLLRHYGSLELAAGPLGYQRAAPPDASSAQPPAPKRIKLSAFLKRHMGEATAERLQRLAAGEGESRAAPFDQWPWVVHDGEFERAQTPAARALAKDFADPRFFGMLGGLGAQLVIGDAGAGLQWHSQQSAYSALVYGRRRWLLAPPALQGRLQGPDSRANGTAAFSSSWPALKFVRERLEPLRRGGATVFECTQGPGEVLFVPKLWAAASLHLAPAVALAREVFNEFFSEIDNAAYLPFRLAVPHPKP